MKAAPRTDDIQLAIPPDGDPRQSSPRKTAAQAAPATTASRIIGFDYVKGALVLIMVLYHWLNYFVATQGYMYRYLRFLTPSFIFITGFLITQIYVGRYSVTDLRPPKRLMERAAKLIAIFIVLNALINLFPAASRNATLGDAISASRMTAVFLTGNIGAGRPAPFVILVPIAYLLAVSACLVLARRLYRGSFVAACIASFLTIGLLGLQGVSSANLELLAAGLLGATLGHISILTLTNYANGRAYVPILGYVAYLVAISLWNERFLIQVFGVCLSVTLLYLLGAHYAADNRLGGIIVLLGKYSLFGYIAQIAILQCLHRTAPHLNALGSLTILPLAAIMTTGMVVLTDRLRARSSLINRAYTVVFS